METNQVKNGIKKRPYGVATLGLSIIIISFIRLFSTGSLLLGFDFLSKTALTYIVIYSVVNNIANIIAAVGVLRVREWARKILIALSALQVVYMLIVSIPTSGKSIELMRADPEAQEMVLSGYRAAFDAGRKEVKVSEEGYSIMVFNVIHIIANIINLICIAFLLFVIYFFTRRNMKEQFIKTANT